VYVVFGDTARYMLSEKKSFTKVGAELHGADIIFNYWVQLSAQKMVYEAFKLNSIDCLVVAPVVSPILTESSGSRVVAFTEI